MARILSFLIRIGGTLALLLGLMFWFITEPDALVPVHMLLGIIVVLSVIIAGVLAFMSPSANKGLAAAGIVVALALVWVGLGQRSWLLGDMHWIIRILHLLVALATVGLGESITRGLRAARA